MIWVPSQPVATTPLEHCPTGIDGLDQITNGGLPRGRTTLVAGGAGCGKTLLATEFLVRGVELDVVLGTHLHVADDPVEEDAHVRPAARQAEPAGVEAGDVEQLGDEPAQAIGVGVHVCAARSCTLHFTMVAQLFASRPEK